MGFSWNWCKARAFPFMELKKRPAATPHPFWISHKISCRTAQLNHLQYRFTCIIRNIVRRHLPLDGIEYSDQCILKCLWLNNSFTIHHLDATATVTADCSTKRWTTNADTYHNSQPIWHVWLSRQIARSHRCYIVHARSWKRIPAINHVGNITTINKASLRACVFSLLCRRCFAIAF